MTLSGHGQLQDLRQSFVFNRDNVSHIQLLGDKDLGPVRVRHYTCFLCGRLRRGAFARWLGSAICPARADSHLPAASGGLRAAAYRVTSEHVGVLDLSRHYVDVPHLLGHAPDAVGVGRGGRSDPSSRRSFL